MKLTLLLLAIVLPVVAFAADVSVVARVLDATDVVSHIAVKVSNNAVPMTISVTATIWYQRYGFDETATSAPVIVQVLHPVTVKGINLNFPSDWLMTTPFVSAEIMDGQSAEWLLEYSKVQVIF